MRIRTGQVSRGKIQQYATNVSVRPDPSVAPLALPHRIDRRETNDSRTAKTAMYEVVALVTTRVRQRGAGPPNWGGLVASTLLVTAIPVGLWLLANPVVGVALLGVVGSVVVAVVSGPLTRRSQRDCPDEAEPLVPVRTGALRGRR